MKKLLKLIVHLVTIVGNGCILAWFVLPIAKGYLAYYPKNPFDPYSFWDFEIGEKVCQKEMSLFAAAEKADSFPIGLFIIFMLVLIFFVFAILFSNMETKIIMPVVMLIDAVIGFQIYKNNDIYGILNSAFSDEFRGAFGDDPDFRFAFDYYEEIAGLPQKVYPWLIAAASLALVISICCRLFQIVKSRLQDVITPMGQGENACPSCGKVNKEGSQYCAACGFKIGGFCCPECGAKREITNQFCKECGKKLPEVNPGENDGMS